MKAERIEPKQEFVPVIVTLESQEEVDSFYVIGNSILMCSVFPALNEMWDVLQDFGSDQTNIFDAKLRKILK